MCIAAHRQHLDFFFPVEDVFIKLSALPHVCLLGCVKGSTRPSNQFSLSLLPIIPLSQCLEPVILVLNGEIHVKARKQTSTDKKAESTAAQT